MCMLQFHSMIAAMSTARQFFSAAVQISINCRIPDDCIDSKRYPLFMAREVMRQLIDNLCVTSAVHPGALS